MNSEKSVFEQFGDRYKEAASIPEMNGRYEIQADAEKRMAPIVAGQLGLTPQDSLLEIGFGAGMLLVPLSFYCARTVGIDHPQAVARLQSSHPGCGFELLSGEFPKTSPQEKFDAILVYSVLHALTSESEIINFVNAAAALLKPGGRLLLGDLPNTDKKDRFLSSSQGKSFSKEWEKRMTAARQEQGQGTHTPPVGGYFMNDSVILRILAALRDQKLNSYIYPQSPDLPFGHTREDILAIKPL